MGHRSNLKTSAERRAARQAINAKNYARNRERIRAHRREKYRQQRQKEKLASFAGLAPASTLPTPPRSDVRDSKSKSAKSPKQTITNQQKLAGIAQNREVLVTTPSRLSPDSDLPPSSPPSWSSTNSLAVAVSYRPERPAISQLEYNAEKARVVYQDFRALCGHSRREVFEPLYLKYISSKEFDDMDEFEIRIKLLLGEIQIRRDTIQSLAKPYDKKVVDEIISYVAVIEAWKEDIEDFVHWAFMGEEHLCKQLIYLLIISYYTIMCMASISFILGILQATARNQFFIFITARRIIMPLSKDEREWAHTYLPSFMEHQNRKTVADFWPPLRSAFFSKFPLEGEADMRVDMDALTREALARASDKKFQSLKNFLNNTSDNNSTRKQRAQVKEAVKIYIGDLGTQSSRMKPANRSNKRREIYSRLFYSTECKEKVDREIVACGSDVTKSDRMKIRNRIVEEGYEAALKDPSKVEAIERAWEEQKEVKVEPPTVVPSVESGKLCQLQGEEHARFMRNLDTTISEVSMKLATLGGLCTMFIAAGMDPDQNKLRTYGFHVGHDIHGQPFYKAFPDYRTKVLRPFLNFAEHALVCFWLAGTTDFLKSKSESSDVDTIEPPTVTPGSPLVESSPEPPLESQPSVILENPSGPLQELHEVHLLDRLSPPSQESDPALTSENFSSSQESQSASTLETSSGRPQDLHPGSSLESCLRSPLEPHATSTLDSLSKSSHESGPLFMLDSQSVTPREFHPVFQLDSLSTTPQESLSGFPLVSLSAIPRESHPVFPLNSLSATPQELHPVYPLDHLSTIPQESRTVFPLDSLSTDPQESHQEFPLDSLSVTPQQPDELYRLPSESQSTSLIILEPPASGDATSQALCFMSDPEFQKAADDALAFTFNSSQELPHNHWVDSDHGLWIDEGTLSHQIQAASLSSHSSLTGESEIFPSHSPCPDASGQILPPVSAAIVHSGVADIQKETLTDTDHHSHDPKSTDINLEHASDALTDLALNPIRAESPSLNGAPPVSNPMSTEPARTAIATDISGSLSGPDLLAATLAQNPGCLQGGTWNPLSINAPPSADSIVSVVSSAISTGRRTGAMADHKKGRARTKKIASRRSVAKRVLITPGTKVARMKDPTKQKMLAPKPKTSTTVEKASTTVEKASGKMLATSGTGQTLMTTLTATEKTSTMTKTQPVKLLLRIPKIASATTGATITTSDDNRTMVNRTKENIFAGQNQPHVSSIAVNEGVVGQLVSSRPKRARKEPPPREPTTIEERNTRLALSARPPKRTSPEVKVEARKKKRLSAA
ncbi:hypothetical protein FB446DRAFT_706079 [Lentinula raphanica]|nr:hypothetical protein FB446DRAFT_706079 [Lentinula raphanica]